MDRSLSSAMLAAMVLAFAPGCGGPSEPGPPAPPTASAAGSAKVASSAAVPAPPRPKPTVLSGGALVRAPSDSALWIADEDHGVVRRIASIETREIGAPPAEAASAVAPGASATPDSSAAPGASAAPDSSANAAPSASAASSASAGAGKKAEAKKPARKPLELVVAPTEVKVPGRPAQVLALADKVLVTVRDPGLLLVLSPDASAREIGRVTVPDDAWGLAVAPDEKTAFVTSAWTHMVSAIDLESLKVKWSVSVPREPRAVVPRKGGDALYVTHLVGPAITRIDDLAGDSPKVSSLALPPDPARTRHNEKLDAALAYSAVLSPDGNRLFVARHALGSMADSAWFGLPTLDVLSTVDDTPALGPRGLPAFGSLTLQELKSGEWRTDAAGAVAGGWTTPFPQPRAIAYRKRADTVLVLSEGVSTMEELDALSLAPAVKSLTSYALPGSAIEPPDAKPAFGVVPPYYGCGAPTGLALSEDELTAFVYCRTTNDLAIIPLPPGAYEPLPKIERTAVHLAEDPGSPEIALGRRLFYDASDQVVSGGLGCAGCHPEGRDDGHVWHEMKRGPYSGDKPIFLASTSLLGSGESFLSKDDPPGGYSRQTPMLAGRVKAAGPYGWHGESADLVARIKAGFGLHRWWANVVDGKTMRVRAEPIAAFVREGLVPPPHPARDLTPEEAHGKELFNADRTRCATCHLPAAEYTDRSPTPLRQLQPRVGYNLDPEKAFKTPSLYGVGGTPPYFHDGNAATLEELIDKNQDRMGRTSSLDADERAALVAFLRTL